MLIFHFHTLPLETIGKLWFPDILGDIEIEYWLKIG